MSVGDDEVPKSLSAYLQRYYELREFLGIALTPTRMEQLYSQIMQYFGDAAKLTCDADAEETAARHTYDVVKAHAGARLRDHLVAGKEPSEARITALLPLEPDVQEARAALDKARYEAQVCQTLYKLYDTQSRLLGKASDMTISRFGVSTSYERDRDELRRARVADERLKEGGHIGRPTS